MGVRKYTGKPRVYFDLDGVLANFEGAAEKRKFSPSHFKLLAGAYFDLEVMQGAKEAVMQVQKLGYEVFILSKIPSGNPYAATEKYLWVKQYFGELIGENVILTPDKGAVGTDKDFLIDDHPEWANAHNFRGTVLHFKGNWDEIIPSIAKVA